METVIRKLPSPPLLRSLCPACEGYIHTRLHSHPRDGLLGSYILLGWRFGLLPGKLGGPGVRLRDSQCSVRLPQATVT